jgi:hypothetical protein
MGPSRLKNVLSSGVKNLPAFAFMIPTFYFFGWWIYWGDAAQYMGPNIADQASGVFFGAAGLGVHHRVFCGLHSETLWRLATFVAAVICVAVLVIGQRSKTAKAKKFDK